MNKKAGCGFRIAVGAYLAYLGGSILYQMTKEKPSNMALMVAVAVVFLIVGAGYAVINIKKLLDIRKEEMSGGADELPAEEGDGAQSLNHTRQIDMDATEIKGVPDAGPEPEDIKDASKDVSEDRLGDTSEHTPGEDHTKEAVEEEIENDYEEK